MRMTQQVQTPPPQHAHKRGQGKGNTGRAKRAHAPTTHPPTHLVELHDSHAWQGLPAGLWRVRRPCTQHLLWNKVVRAGLRLGLTGHLIVRLLQAIQRGRALLEQARRKVPGAALPSVEVPPLGTSTVRQALHSALVGVGWRWRPGGNVLPEAAANGRIPTGPADLQLLVVALWHHSRGRRAARSKQMQLAPRLLLHQAASCGMLLP